MRQSIDIIAQCNDLGSSNNNLVKTTDKLKTVKEKGRTTSQIKDNSDEINLRPFSNDFIIYTTK